MYMMTGNCWFIVYWGLFFILFFENMFMLVITCHSSFDIFLCFPVTGYLHWQLLWVLCLSIIFLRRLVIITSLKSAALVCCCNGGLTNEKSPFWVLTNITSCISDEYDIGSPGLMSYTMWRKCKSRVSSNTLLCLIIKYLVWVHPSLFI